MSLEALKTQIKNANDVGRTNLNAKGVTTDGTETTYQIMSKIASVVIGSGGCNVDHNALKQEGYDEGFADGQASGGTTAPNPLEYVNSLYNSFKGVTFPTDYELTLNIPRVTTLASAFYDASGIKKVTIKGNENGNIVDFNTMYRQCKSIETLDMTEFNVKPSTVNLAFYYCEALKYIYGELDFSECTNTNNWLQNCKALEEIRFKADTIKISISFAQSSNLSATSIQSIFKGLCSGVSAQTLTLPTTLNNEAQAVVNSYLVESDGTTKIVVDGEEKVGWTLVQ